MTVATQSAAFDLLSEFLRGDGHYLASSVAYGDGGADALARALQLFLDRPELGFVWLASDEKAGALGACVVCYAISTSRGSLVAKLDDVVVRDGWQGRGVGATMLTELAAHLRARDVTRIDSACHRNNAAAWHFYERLGFRPLDEERIAWLIAEGR
jgi:ribosomal protein S18 acetylase RimI-like enzyme